MRNAKSFPLQDLILLGILMDGPQHGYEMRQLMARRMGQIETIPPGTLYYTLSKLERRGLVLMKRDREGNRPERMVYSIAPAGRQRFQELMREAFLVEDRPYSTFDAGYYFMAHGDLEDALHGAERQAATFAAMRDHVASLERAYPVRWPFYLDAIKQHTLAVVEAHLSFYGHLQDDLRERIARARGRGKRRALAHG
ncbi:MAG: PadR family transcriptional regulator [Acidobacteriota bacterium]